MFFCFYYSVHIASTHRIHTLNVFFIECGINWNWLKFLKQFQNDHKKSHCLRENRSIFIVTQIQSIVIIYINGNTQRLTYLFINENSNNNKKEREHLKPIKIKRFGILFSNHLNIDLGLDN